jgi:hypothetical protein
MYPLIVTFVIGVVGWLAWRGARREISRVNSELKQSKKPKNAKDDGTTLKQDPKTGVYRVDEDGE